MSQLTKGFLVLSDFTPVGSGMRKLRVREVHWQAQIGPGLEAGSLDAQSSPVLALYHRGLLTCGFLLAFSPLLPPSLLPSFLPFLTLLLALPTDEALRLSPLP